MLIAFDRAVQGQHGGDRRLPRQRPTGTSAQAGIRKAAEAGAVTLTSLCAVSTSAAAHVRHLYATAPKADLASGAAPMHALILATFALVGATRPSYSSVLTLRQSL